MSIFKRKIKLSDLEKAQKLNLITELECLKLKKDRLDEEIKKHLEKHKGRKKRK